jgi:hypothetical protein
MAVMCRMPVRNVWIPSASEVDTVVGDAMRGTTTNRDVQKRKNPVKASQWGQRGERRRGRVLVVEVMGDEERVCARVSESRVVKRMKEPAEKPSKK